MEARAVPAAAVGEGFEDEQGLSEFPGPLDGALEAEVPGGSAEGKHPVEDEGALGARAVGVERPDAVFGDRLH